MAIHHLIEREPGDGPHRDERLSRPGGAEGAEPRAAGGDSLESLRATLEAERKNRAWLESRLEELDKRLSRALEAERAMETAAARDQVAALSLHAEHAPARNKEADREALSMWIVEAQIRADAAEPQPLVPTYAAAAPIIREPVIIRETVTVREAVVDARLEEKIASARLAVEAAEARAAHNAAQVRRLTEELANARTEQMRTMNRLKDMEKRLLGLESRTELLDAVVAEKVTPQGAPEFELPADTMAPLAPEKPKLVFTETDEGTQLAPLEPELVDEAQALSLEEFEPKRRAPAPVEEDAVFEIPSAPAESGVSLVDAFTDLFGEPEQDFAPAQAAPAAKAGDQDLDVLAEALEMWGSGPPTAATQAPAAAPEPVALSEPEPAPVPEVDPFAGLASALESLSEAPIEEEKIESAPVDDSDPFGGLADALESMQTAPVTEVAADAETLVAERVEEMAAPVEHAPVEAAHEVLQEDVPVYAEEVSETAETLIDERRPRSSGLREARQERARREAGNQPASAVGKKGKGSAAMVDALMKFMGPQ